MSRSGKRPIALPKGVEVTAKGNLVTVKGPRGTLEQIIPEGITLEVKDDQVLVAPANETDDLRRQHGLARALVNNLVTGASTGFVKRLELVGVGFRAAVKGEKLDLQLGFSHPTAMEIPAGISVKVEDHVRVAIEGSDAQQVGQFAASVRDLRPPEPYKGKGVRYAGEYVRRKAGKAAK